MACPVAIYYVVDYFGEQPFCRPVDAAKLEVEAEVEFDALCKFEIVGENVYCLVARRAKCAVHRFLFVWIDAQHGIAEVFLFVEGYELYAGVGETVGEPYKRNPAREYANAATKGEVAFLVKFITESCAGRPERCAAEFLVGLYLPAHFLCVGVEVGIVGGGVEEYGDVYPEAVCYVEAVAYNHFVLSVQAKLCRAKLCRPVLVAGDFFVCHSKTVAAERVVGLSVFFIR